MDATTRTSATAQRALMVWEQLVRRGIRDQRVLEAMGRVAREEFVPADLQGLAYLDRAVPIGRGQTVSQPYIVALTLEALRLDEEHRVLEVGTGSGYQTALLSLLCREIVSLERIPELAEGARERLARLALADRVRPIIGDGTLGNPGGAPYDRIVVSAGSPSVPPALLDQLDEGGILVIPVGDRRGQELLRIERRRGEFLREELSACVFVPLVGADGWSEEVELE